jgi:hypothetical protein
VTESHHHNKDSYGLVTLNPCASPCMHSLGQLFLFLSFMVNKYSMGEEENLAAAQ